MTMWDACRACQRLTDSRHVTYSALTSLPDTESLDMPLPSGQVGDTSCWVAPPLSPFSPFWQSPICKTTVLVG